VTKETEQNPGGAEAPPFLFDKDLQPSGVSAECEGPAEGCAIVCRDVKPRGLWYTLKNIRFTSEMPGFSLGQTDARRLDP